MEVRSVSSLGMDSSRGLTATYTPTRFQPRPGRSGRRDRSPRTSGAPFLGEKDSDHAERRPLQISPGLEHIRGRIVDSADILSRFYHLDERVSGSPWRSALGTNTHFRWRRRHVRLGNQSVLEIFHVRSRWGRLLTIPSLRRGQNNGRTRKNSRRKNKFGIPDRAYM